MLFYQRQVRALREEMPSNMATLCYKAVERIVAAARNMCNSHHEQQTGERAFPFDQTRSYARRR